MRIQFERSGGFAGVTRKASIDTTRLPPAEKAQLETLANAMVQSHHPRLMRRSHSFASSSSSERTRSRML